MNNIVSCAFDYALKLGMSPSLSGFHQFVQAVAAYVSAQEFPTLGNICKTIGNQHSMQLNTVEHSISYALKTTPNLCENIYTVTGFKVYPSDIRPKYVICLVAQCIKRDLEELA